MGSDFDWDTAYTYFKQYSVNDKGEIQVKSDLSELEQFRPDITKLALIRLPKSKKMRILFA